MDKMKKMQAAIAGVLYYLKSEEETPIQEPLVTVNYPVPWALHGRQMMMQTRTLTQRRVLKR